MQEWLKDKKNLPIVAALMVVMLLVAGGVIALESGAFESKPAATPFSAQQTIPGGPPVGTGGPPSPGRPPTGGPPTSRRPGLPSRLPQRGALGTAAATAAVTPKSDIVNPLVGPDPFKIPGGAQKEANARAAVAGPKPALRNVIGPLNLFQIRPPTPPPTPSVFDTQRGGEQPNLAANYRLSGLINGPDGNNAILEVGGQSQSVKPGDTLADGTNVQSIQSTSVTLKSTNGSIFVLPLSAGTPDQGTIPFNGQPQYPGGFNGQPQYPGGFNGQPQVN